jgi:acyl-homoserine-lactone acylase
MAYAQAEDDFNRVETNYLTSLGRTAEAEGAGAIWADLRAKLYMDPAVLKAEYEKSPAWLKALMDAWADGLNFYLATHPQVKPRVISRFEPWMALSFTEGSIGGDIERISLKELEAFYGGARTVALEDAYAYREPTGSNGIAISPKITRDGHALLLINPHTSFFFRSELQMASDEGLNAYGGVTWGSSSSIRGSTPTRAGCTPRAAWTWSTSSPETLVRRGRQAVYRYGAELRQVTDLDGRDPYRGATGR